MSAQEFRPKYITIHAAHDVSTVGFRLSELNDEENIELLGRELFALVDQVGCRKIILDLAQVRYMTSAVLGKLISLHRKLHRSDGRLVICNVGDELNRIMSASRLNTYFNLADDLPAAGQMIGSE